jgi:hypothetical protein
LDNHGLDARLHRSDVLLQLADVGDELCCELPAGDRRRSDRRHISEQGSGPLGED